MIWVWASMKPGSSVALPRSMTLASAETATADALPTATIRSPATTIAASVIGAPPLPSIRRAAWRTTVCPGRTGAESCALTLSGATANVAVATARRMSWLARMSERRRGRRTSGRYVIVGPGRGPAASGDVPHQARDPSGTRMVLRCQLVLPRHATRTRWGVLLNGLLGHFRATFLTSRLAPAEREREHRRAE